MKRLLAKINSQYRDQYTRDLEHHIIYQHDEASSPVLKPYCSAYTLYPLLVDGTNNVDGTKNKAPKHLSSFCGQFQNLVFLLSAQKKGAGAYGEFFNFFDHYAAMEYGEDYHKNADKYADTEIVKKRKTIGDKIDQTFQQIVFYWNQPAGNRGSQSPFSNISYYDEVVSFFDNINSSNAIKEILLIIFFPLVCFFEIMFELLIIFHLDPFFILIKDNLYYFLVRIIFIFFNINDNLENYLTERFFILEFAEILALLGTCVYLQIIELRICQLDKNLNKNIIEREIEERRIKLFNMSGSSGTDYYNIEEEQQLDLTKSSIYV